MLIIMAVKYCSLLNKTVPDRWGRDQADENQSPHVDLMRGGNLKDVFQEESVEFWQLPHNEEKGHSHYPHGGGVGIQPAHIVPATKLINRNCTFNTTHFNGPGTCMYKDIVHFSIQRLCFPRKIYRIPVHVNLY